MHKQPPLAGWAYNRDMQSRGHGQGRLGFIELLGTMEMGALHAPPGGMEPGLEREMTFEEWAGISLVVMVRTLQGEGSKRSGQPGKKKKCNVCPPLLAPGLGTGREMMGDYCLKLPSKPWMLSSAKTPVTCLRADTAAVCRITPSLPHSCLRWSYHDSCLRVSKCTKPQSECLALGH